MNKNYVLAAAALVAVITAGGYAIYEIGMRRGSSMAAMPGVAPVLQPPGAVPQSIAEGEEATRRHMAGRCQGGDMDPANGRKILYYHDPMVPGNKFDKPAKSPFMDMMLVPAYAGGDTDQGKVTVSPRIQQNLGVRTAVVTEGKLTPQVAAVGSIAFNERDQVVVQARAAGYVERCTCAQRWIASARASHWLTCMCRIGWPRRRSSSRSSGCRAMTWQP
jgi:Cu(I)/Ag(I) efflux system membrane fusion protein